MQQLNEPPGLEGRDISQISTVVLGDGVSHFVPRQGVVSRLAEVDRMIDSRSINSSTPPLNEKELEKKYIVKFIKQEDPHNEYETHDDCASNEWQYDSYRLDLQTEGRQCSQLDLSVCPTLGGALLDVQWAENKPFVKCTYDIDQITTAEQINEYITHWGRDKDFNTVLMPMIVFLQSNDTPPTLNGVEHHTCSTLLAQNPLGVQARAWMQRLPKISDEVIEEYCLATGGTDCDCVLRDMDPLYWYISIHPLMKNITPMNWFIPARDRTGYLQTSDMRILPIPKIEKKLSKWVNGVVNDIAAASDTPDETKEAIQRICAFPIRWYRVPSWRKRWIVNHIKKNPHQYYGRKNSLRSRTVLSQSDLETETPVENMYSLSTEETKKIKFSFLRKGKKGKLTTQRYRGTGSNGLVAIIAFVILIIVVILIIFLIYRSQKSGGSQTSGYESQMRSNSSDYQDSDSRRIYDRDDSYDNARTYYI